jgi:hypothetical protein
MTTGTTFEVPPTPTGVYTIAIGGSGGGGGILSSITTPPVPYVDHTITGETVLAEYITTPSYKTLNQTDEEIKGLLIEKLIHEMYKTGKIEFTQMTRHDTDEKVFRARIHVVPDTQVRLIRELKSAK